jgi:diacylglycerol kinase
MDKNDTKNHMDVLRRRIFAPFKKKRVHSISFVHAWHGIVFAFKTQPNFRFHLVVAILVVVAGWYFEIGNLEWVILAFTIMTVLVAETINTALEQVVDLLTDKYHLNAKNAKDVAAGMVLVAVVFAVIVGLIIFLPHVTALVPLQVA